MSLMLVSRHEPYPLLLEKYVVSYKVILSIPEDSLAKNYENVNDLYIELSVPKSEYRNEQVQEIIRWSRLPARDPHYYRDIAIHQVVMGGFKRSIVFSHGRISCERTADTEADFETIKIFVSQKEDRYEGVVFGTDLDATYAKAWEMLKPKPVTMAQTTSLIGTPMYLSPFESIDENSIDDRIKIEITVREIKQSKQIASLNGIPQGIQAIKVSEKGNIENQESKPAEITVTVVRYDKYENIISSYTSPKPLDGYIYNGKGYAIDGVAFADEFGLDRQIQGESYRLSDADHPKNPVIISPTRHGNGIPNGYDVNKACEDVNKGGFKITASYTLEEIEEWGEDDKKAFETFTEFDERFGDTIESFATEHKINPLYLKAFVFTESGGTGFYEDGRLLIRFENYTFVNRAGLSKELVKTVSNSKEYYRKSINSDWISIHDTVDTRYSALEWAIGLDKASAYESLSMGFPQTMGFNYRDLGYSSAEEMFNKFSTGYTAQMEGFTAFLLNYHNGDILNALQKSDYVTAIKFYNGDAGYSGSLDKFERAAGIKK